MPKLLKRPNSVRPELAALRDKIVNQWLDPAVDLADIARTQQALEIAVRGKVQENNKLQCGRKVKRERWRHKGVGLLELM